MQIPPVIITLAEIKAFTDYSDNDLADAMEQPLEELTAMEDTALFVVKWPDDVEDPDYGDTVESWTFIAETMTVRGISSALANHSGPVTLTFSAAVEEFADRAVRGGGR